MRLTGAQAMKEKARATERLPTAREINPYDDLDGRYAQKNFLGKSCSEAEALFRSHFFHYGEDLIYMGAEAFVYYVPAAVNYLNTRPDRKDDFQDDEWFFQVLLIRIKCSPDDVRPLASLLLEYARGVLERFDAADDEVRDWTPRVGDLSRELLSRLSPTPRTRNDSGSRGAPN